MRDPTAASSATGISIVRVNRLELSLASQPWPFAQARRAEIDRHFDTLKRSKPALWNGRVLLLHQHTCVNGVFRGTCLQTDFASLMAWRDWGWPDASVKNCFGMGALRGSDGAFLLGVMGQHTANAGSIYFPAGLLDPSDVVGNAVDLAGNVLREVAEETGLGPDDYEAELGWYSVFAGPRIAQIKILRARETAPALRARILAHLARESEPELADIRIVATRSDLEPMVPLHVAAFLNHVWSSAP
jgi:8-oxo-dGTP pyrophosphatase MutT (NUDIX family)